MPTLVQTLEFESWLRRLKDRQGRLRILERLDRLTHGNPGDTKSLGSGLRQLRLGFGSGYRIYYTRDSDVVILLLCGGDKSTQAKDIEKAHRLATEWRKDTGDDDEK